MEMTREERVDELSPMVNGVAWAVCGTIAESEGDVLGHWWRRCGRCVLAMAAMATTRQRAAARRLGRSRGGAEVLEPRATIELHEELENIRLHDPDDPYARN